MKILDVHTDTFEQKHALCKCCISELPLNRHIEPSVCVRKENTRHDRLLAEEETLC